MPPSKQTPPGFTGHKDRIEHIYQTFPLANLGAHPAGFNQPDAAT